MPSVAIRPRALTDLVDIWAYIAAEHPGQADAFADRIDRKFQVLARRPRLGRSRPELAANLRSFPVGRYVIFYLPLAKGIEVVRVLHGSRDLGSALEDLFAE